MTATVCGLPIDGAEEVTQPLAALVVVKCFDPDSEVGVSYRVRATTGLSSVEALGMADFAVLRLKNELSE